MKNKLFIFFSFFIVFILINNVHAYAIEDLPVFHLESSIINFTNDSLSKDFGYYLTTPGNDSGIYSYTVSIEGGY